MSAEEPSIERGAPDERVPCVAGRFANPDGSHRVGLDAVLRWRLQRLFQPNPAGPQEPWPAPVPPAVHAFAPAPSVTWVGHATALIRLPGLCVLTDPLWGAPPMMRRFGPPPPPPGELPAPDAVLISHNHYDHLDAPSVRALPAATLFVVPTGLGAWFRRRGRRVVELDWGDRLALPGGSVHCVPAVHWSRRTAIDENRSLWAGYVVEAGPYRVYFAGDTARGDHFAAIGRAHTPALSLLPIGAVEPRYIMAHQHLAPAEALDALGVLGGALLPIHWGSLKLSDEAPNDPARWITGAGPGPWAGGAAVVGGPGEQRGAVVHAPGVTPGSGGGLAPR